VSRRFTLYWSSLDMYEKCPQMFLWGRGWGAIDVGGGPGRKKPKPLKDSKHHALMGIVLAAVIEDFYNDELWKEPLGLRQRLEERTRKKFALQLARMYIDWRKAPPREEMFRICYDGAINFVKRTLKTHKLLGTYARSEVDLIGFVDKWNPIGGRADIIIRRPDTGVTILDGKNSKEHWNRSAKQPKFYTDDDQLRWYAFASTWPTGKCLIGSGFAIFVTLTGTPGKKKPPDIGRRSIKAQRMSGKPRWRSFTKGGSLLRESLGSISPKRT